MKTLSSAPLVLLCTALSLLLSSCAFYPRDSLPEQAVTPMELVEPKVDQQAKLVQDLWWTVFEDPQLNQLVTLSLRSSPSLEISGARIVAAQAMLDTETAAFLPQIGVGGQVDRQQLSQNYIFLPSFPVYTGYGLVNASLNWSLDIWGKQKKYFDAAKNQVKAVRANYQASALLLSTTVVRVYFDYDRAVQMQTLYAKDVELKKNLYQIALDRQKVGIADATLVNQRKVDFEGAQANVSQAKLTVKIMQHQLAALAKEGPSWGEALKPPILQANALNLPETIPANLLERRPDLQALLSQIDVAKLQLEGAKLEYLPDVNLAGFFGFQSFGLSQLFASKSQQFSIGPAINLPIFDGGLIAANITSKEAGRNQAIATYQEQLVQALREVADGISSMKSSQANYESYTKAFQSAKTNYDITQRRSDVGINSKESVLNAEQAYIVQGQNYADAKAKMLTANVVLVQALGGSYLRTTAQSH
ncbi:efflux transporter outer membrane subunit [Polynucleobacter meluiroseus]|nr:efflux transporter outer membrane subunit [Polynucleobacter meluiroseus]